MRRVAVGDELAQLANRDPFSVPSWRSPVFRTPLGIVAVVQAVRLLVRLIRFLVRHPIAVTAVLVAVVVWRLIGWLGLVVVVLVLAAALVVWWRRLPR
jgi:S-DNA-T family DNA segregation ATPase FtsK/SpoIIIE